MIRRMLCVAIALGLLSALLTGPAYAQTQTVEYPYEKATEVISNKVIEEETALAAAINAGRDLPAKSAILIEQSTGRILFAKNEHERLPPASITKVMSLLLVMQAIDNGRIKPEDKVTCSEHAASMGGSQIWLEPGEQMTVEELLRAATISSANDATVALGEHIAGSEEAFVQMMNQEAVRLGMADTNFVNASGLDAPDHLTSAHDIAIMSAELMKYPDIIKYTTTWMDSLRGGETQLVNTNRLVRFYEGATGLKTGTTNGAGSCLTATATRGGMSVVAVVMGCPTSDQRFAAARSLLDHAFANYTRAVPAPIDDQLQPVKVLRGVKGSITPTYQPPNGFVVDKTHKDNLQQQIELVENLEAPVEKGQKIGRVLVSVEGEMIGEYPLLAGESIKRMNFFTAFDILIKAAVFPG